MQSICLFVGIYPGYGMLPPELARDPAAAAAVAAAAADGMAHLASLGSLSPGGLAYARAAMVCCLSHISFTSLSLLLLRPFNSLFSRTA